MNTKKMVYDIYISTIYRWGLLTLVCACLCATIIYTISKIFGLYPQVSWLQLLIFDAMDLLFFFIALYIIRRSVHNGVLRENRLCIGKIFSFASLVIQWNYILYMIPSGTFWGFFFFFLILTCFFLDVRLILLTGTALILSLFISCRIKGHGLFYTEPELLAADYMILITSIVLSVIGILIFVFFMTHIQWIYQKREQQMTLQKKYYYKLIQKETGIRQFRHDIKKHIMALEALCEENNFPAVKEYVDALSGLEIRNSLVHTGNGIADCFVNDLIDEVLKTDSLTWQVIGKFPDDIAVSENDFCVIFGNAIENAKEALMALPPEREKTFFLTIKHYRERLYITIKNAADESATVQDGVFYSTKRGDGTPGYGLHNIKMTVESYGGTVEWHLEEGLFSIDIHI